MTGQAIGGDFAFSMAIHAKAHRVVDDAAGDRHLRDVAMAYGTLDVLTDVRSMVEANMSFFRPAVNALPRRFLTFFVVCRQFLNRGLVSRHIFMTAHTQRDAGEM